MAGLVLWSCRVERKTNQETRRILPRRRVDLDALLHLLALRLSPLAVFGMVALASLLAFSLWPLALLPPIQWPLALFRLSACMLLGSFAKLKGSLTILVLARPL